MAEAGDIIEGIKSGIWATGGPDIELSDVIAGKKPGRQSPADITIFKSVGGAFQDVAVASWVHQQALRAARHELRSGRDPVKLCSVVVEGHTDVDESTHERARTHDNIPKSLFVRGGRFNMGLSCGPLSEWERRG